MEPSEIEKILLEKLNLSEVFVQGSGSHYQVIAVSDEFANMNRVKAQQYIYAPLSPYLASNQIHALTIKTYTVEKFKRDRLLLNL